MSDNKKSDSSKLNSKPTPSKVSCSDYATSTKRGSSSKEIQNSQPAISFNQGNGTTKSNN